MYDYKPGKLDWMAAGLSTDGKNARVPRAGDLARKGAATCSLDERLDDVRVRLDASGADAAVVVNQENVVLGILRAKELRQPGELTVAEAMQPGPSTFRPYVSAQEMADFMVEHELDSSPITTYDGRLIGLLYQADAVREARKQAA